MDEKVPSDELKSRLKRFRAEMDRRNPGWEMAAIFGKVNLYYFTGTMQDGVLLIRQDGDAVFWVRRSFQRAAEESFFSDIRPMRSYRDAAAGMGDLPEKIWLETELVTLGVLERFRKHFGFKSTGTLDHCLGMVRAQKSGYELSLMERSGKIQRHVLEDLAPGILKEGMSELDLALEVYSLMMDEGHHGITRFGMFDTEILIGQVGFGVNSIYPTCFNGPGGSAGLCSAVPCLGSRERKLRKGDLVFADTGTGFCGYHTDKTMTYVFKGTLPEEAVEAHQCCVEIQDKIASMLKPGAIPSEIYKTTIESLDKDFLEDFMGYGGRTVNFIGHGVGLLIDEIPVIAAGYDEPLVENMTFALEPKKGVKGVGMVGTENTFVVTSSGGRSITGSHPGLMQVE